MSWESRLSVVKRPSEEEPAAEGVARTRTEVPGPNLRRARSESSRFVRSEDWEQHALAPAPAPRLTRSFTHYEVDDDRDDDHYYTVQQPPLSWRYHDDGEATLADRHLESLLIQEKAGAVAGASPDLSNLYEVKTAEGIPENESIEQRAARILGISVPAAALNKQDNEKGGLEGQDIASIAKKPLLQSDSCPDIDTGRGTDRETQQVSRSSAEESHGKPETSEKEAEVEETHLEDYHPLQERTDIVEDAHSVEGACDGENQPAGAAEDKLAMDAEISPVDEEDRRVAGGERNSFDGDLPEFPPSKRPLSLPGGNPDQGLTNGGPAAIELPSEETLTSASSLSSCSTLMSPDPLQSEEGFNIESPECAGQTAEGRGEQGGGGGREREEEREEVRAQAEEEIVGDGEENEVAFKEGEEGGEGVVRKEVEEAMWEGKEECGEKGKKKELDRKTGMEEEGEMLGVEMTSKKEGEKEIELRIAEEEDKLEVKEEEEQEERRRNGGGEEDLAFNLKVVEKKSEIELKVEERKEVPSDLKPEEVEGRKEIKVELEAREKEVELKIEEHTEEVKEEKEQKEAEFKVKEREMELRIEEEEEKEGRMNVGVKEEAEEKKKQSRPKPRPRPHKPPLLPKPRPRSAATVAKREITLPSLPPRTSPPQSFNNSCSSATEDEEQPAISDSYDPSRVERV